MLSPQLLGKTEALIQSGLSYKQVFWWETQNFWQETQEFWRETLPYIKGCNPSVCAELAKRKEQDAKVKPDILYFTSG